MPATERQAIGDALLGREPECAANDHVLRNAAGGVSSVDLSWLDVITIRYARANEAPALEALQRRSSDVWDAYRDQLAANPDAIELPQTFIDNGWVRVAVADDETPIGFSVVIPADGQLHELDGLFVEPAHMRRGVGRALVEDAATRTAGEGARSLEVTAGPGQGFYERVGFQLVGTTQTRFGPAVRMRRSLHGDQRRDAAATG